MARAQSFLRRWEEIVGPMLATKSWPDRWDHGTVWVSVTSASWAQELRMMKGTILGRLATMSQEGDLFTSVRFGVRPIRRELAPPEAIIETPYEPAPEHLSLREIAERRLARWDEGSGSA